MSNEISQFSCKYPNCAKHYTSKYNLRRHIESIHIKTRRFRCRTCGKYLSSKQNLQEHLYTHSKERPYKCTELHCTKSFRQSSQLSNHKKLHEELLKYCTQQNQFVSLKIDSCKLEEILLQKSNTDFQEPEHMHFEDFGQQGKIFLPKLSGPQISVSLPSVFSKEI